MDGGQKLVAITEVIFAELTGGNLAGIAHIDWAQVHPNRWRHGLDCIGIAIRLLPIMRVIGVNDPSV